ncbi:MAG: hypothetical protein A2830_01315 [Candidatus Taylorbacteria bacterium RIFCSPHIGHO2_01_FULL_44_110]|uniref:histidine kinase n=1 Tax=Candidatus Taylorbacteria bacterium RIFCSPHIGHO2_12_FULL_45_16 TaxID=1802315 RepID=A0A1G2MYT3_9BACT|nr:MAG: hypothetical protein A2830_01315 [Candidatus Taylorbacteria bacterium RIFCSPHIGHO2_01_FULL_44_110]OHA29095.1 MAG: hypothetical protein A3F51_00525 [Candidatus Taylorbacteria bacterium RIFCSPHIGHO2_12_FULL_45_16]OHA33317.1 MAG: hypothetical protein A3A23_01405 [Candidatus Taylorbacteria bacterium RIFCSPLOWO2_01_FULL_45_59]OHA38931.1 MAG: hypothetical protein A3I98_02615 [Candidatus Taylorbacteria bacterium RIFCSPLOWO2_02_FULL_45_10b]OHA44450.1 MAG: hypothetical protein A3G04_03210 [Candi
MTPLASKQVYVEGMSAAGILSIQAVDIVMYGLIIVLIMVIIWLSNRHIKTSRDYLNTSEKRLESERDSLERRIAERTAAFVHAEEQRLIELQKNAEFGKLSQGLFHDLISPLSAVSLYAQQLETNPGYSEKTKEMIRTVIDSSKRMNSFMESVRRSLGVDSVSQEKIKDTNVVVTADLRREIEIIQDILGYKARMVGVGIEVHQKEKILLPIHPVRLHQLILNLVSNAIDACVRDLASLEKTEHLVTISAIRKEIDGKSLIELSVSDTGCGISSANQARMFKEKFTTKSGGSGIGLMAVKTIVEKDLNGTIQITSEKGKGAKFVISIAASK